MSAEARELAYHLAQMNYPECRKADVLLLKQAKAIERLTAELQTEKDEHDRADNNLGLMLTRAEKAEAERDALRAELQQFIERDAGESL